MSEGGHGPLFAAKSLAFESPVDTPKGGGVLIGMPMTNRICHIEIDETGLARATAEIEQERKVAIYDLLEENVFALPKREGREVAQSIDSICC